ncbi:hypothetical protein ASA1KI_25050 [Opitutales bacterium ASA1]|jgi:hypothetical protein|nr:hypothetical protein ASA1KI_25050 [Opitutales bacterium ASA1]
MELRWWKRDDENGKYQMHLDVFGKKLHWRCQMKRFEPWRDYTNPTDEDWDKALELVENCYQRRLTTKEIVDLVRRRGAR